jgi:hypothetical protein
MVQSKVFDDKQRQAQQVPSFTRSPSSVGIVPKKEFPPKSSTSVVEQGTTKKLSLAYNFICCMRQSYEICKLTQRCRDDSGNVVRADIERHCRTKIC